MITRRAFLGTLAGGLVAAPLAAEGQQVGKVYRVGILGEKASDPSEARLWQALLYGPSPKLPPYGPRRETQKERTGMIGE